MMEIFASLEERGRMGRGEERRKAMEKGVDST
jgi:hypothetical protein